jgi:formate dehydrogenase subunit gamma
LSTVSFSAARAAEIIAAHPAAQASLLPILHDLQAAFGHVPEAAVPQVARALNLSRADVHGVVGFYHDFRDAPPGRHVIRLCAAEACQAMGGEALAEAVSAALDLEVGRASDDGAVTLEAVYCLGLCACAPSAMVDGRLVARATPERVLAMIEPAGVPS